MPSPSTINPAVDVAVNVSLRTIAWIAVAVGVACGFLVVGSIDLRRRHKRVSDTEDFMSKKLGKILTFMA